MTITSIRLKSYKRFDDFRLYLKSGNILIGPNNTGKSSILDALRLLDIGLKQFRRSPKYIVSGNIGFYGYTIPDDALPFVISNAVRNYADEDAEICIKHENGNEAIFLLHPDRKTRFYVRSNTSAPNPKTISAYRKAFPLKLLVVPTLGPLEVDEEIRVKNTVAKNISTRRAAINFRNIWYWMPPSDFDVFARRIKESWDGITIREPKLKDGYLTMFYEEGRIPREIQWSGFGFQIWLQIQTHLARGDEDTVLVLDEPDIYLHPDLQRRLYRDISRHYKQFVVATHATEFINEADTRELLVIDSNKNAASRISSDKQYASMMQYIGSAENVDFAKIAKLKRVIFVEGKDAKLLKSFSDKLSLKNLRLLNTPMQQVGGFSQSDKVANAAWAFRELVGVDIETISIFDRDYRCDEEVEEFMEETSKHLGQCFVLGRKEIENYALQPLAIERAANLKLKQSGKPVLPSGYVSEMLEEICEDLFLKVSCQLEAHYQTYHQPKRSRTDSASLLAECKASYLPKWRSLSGRLALVPGKEALRAVVSRLQSEHSVNVTAVQIIRQCNPSLWEDDFHKLLNRLDSFSR